MLIYLFGDETIQTIRNPAAEEYIKHAFDILAEIDTHGLCGIRNHSKWYAEMIYENVLYYPELYGLSNSCRALLACRGRLPSFGNTLCYFSGAGNGIENMQITIVDKEKRIYFCLCLCGDYRGDDAFGHPINTENLV